MRKWAFYITLAIIPMMVLAVGGTKRIIELPGFNTNRALIVNGSNEIDESTVTSTELGYLSGATANVLTEASTIPLIQLEALTSNNIVITDNAGVLTSSGVDSSRVQYLDPVNSDLCGIDDTCTQTNKTFTSPVANLITLDGQTGTPTSPSSGDVKFYAKSDENLYYLNSAGLEQRVGTGSGQGINYYGDFQANTISNLVEFDDGAIGDLDGGTAANLSTALNSSTPISETNSYRISKSGADASFEGVRMLVDSSLDALAENGKTLVLSFNYRTSANYNNGTEQVSVYYFRVGLDSTAQACNGRTLGGSISATLPVASVPTQFSCALNLTSAVTAVRIGFVVTGTGTSTWDLDLDTIKLGVDQTVPAPIVTDSTSFTPTLEGTSSDPTLGSGATASGTYSRTGQYMEIEFNFVIGTGPTNGSGYYFIPLPSGFTLDSSMVDALPIGTARVFNAGVTDYPNLNLSVDKTNNGLIINFDGNYIGQNVPASNWLTVNDRISGRAVVKIASFANGSALVSTTQVDLTTVKVRATTTGAPTASPGLSNTTNSNLVYGTESVDSHNAYNTSTGVFTAPSTGYYDIEASTILSGTYASFGQTIIGIEVNGSPIKRKTTYINSGSSTVQGAEVVANAVFLNRGDTVNAYVIPDQWSSVGFVTDANMHQFSVSQRPDFSTFGVYGNYEYTEAIVSADVTAAVAGTVYDATGGSISVTPGTWNVCHSSGIFFDWVSTTVTQTCKAFIRDSSNNVIGAHALTAKSMASDTDNIATNVKNCVEVTPTASTTYKLSLQCSQPSSTIIAYIISTSGFSGVLTDPDTQSKIWARRMK